MTRRRRLVATLGCGGLLVLPLLAPSTTLAAWTDRQYTGAAVGAAPSDCTADHLYRAVADARWLTGSTAGAALATTSGLGGLHAANDGTTLTATSGSTQTGSTAALPLSSASANAALSAAGAPVQSPAGGSYRQVTAASATGSASAASGAVTASGAIDTGGIAAGSQPDSVTIDVSHVLAAANAASAAPALSHIAVDVGPVAATAALNECALLWGAPIGTALTRSSTLGSLRIRLADAATSTLLSALATQSTQVTATLTTVTGTGSVTSPTEASLATTAGTDLASAVTTALGVVGGVTGATVGSPSSTVTLVSSQSGIGTASGETLPTTSSGVGLNATDGTVSIDVGRFAALGTQPPNTVVLTPAVVAASAAALGPVLTSHATNVEQAWQAANAATSVHIQTTVPLVVLGASLGSVAIDSTGTVADFASGHETRTAPTVTSSIAGLSASALLTALTAPLGSVFWTPMESAIVQSVQTPVSNSVTAATNTITTAVTSARAAVGADLAPLASLLSVTLDEQPDVTPNPDSWSGSTAAGVWAVSAVRFAVHLTSSDPLVLFLGSASVGPVGTLNG